MAPIFRNRYYTRELITPKLEGKEPRLLLRCVFCNQPTESKWPINTSNLVKHILTKHKDKYKGDLETNTRTSYVETISSNDDTSNDDDDNYSNKDNSNNEDENRDNTNNSQDNRN